MNTEKSSTNSPSFTPPAAPAAATSTSSTQGNNSISHNAKNTNRVNLTSHRQRIIPRLRSNLSTIDSKFIELTRCLYQAKAIVQDLSSFYASVLPALSLSTYHDPALSPQADVGSVAFLQHIKQYLDDNFTKFTKLCKILIMILARLEQNAQVKQERVQSFRNEIMEEWRVASDIKRRIQTYLHQNNSLFDGSSGTMEATAGPQSEERQRQASSTETNQKHGYRNIPPHLFPALQSLDQQRHQSSDSASSRHSYHHYSGSSDTYISPLQVSDMASGGILESMSCSDSPSTQMGSPTSTVSG